MSRVVGFGMYRAGPGTDERFWAGLRRHLQAEGIADLPLRVATDTPEEIWDDPQLLLAQTCGFPLTHALKGKVRYVGTPVYAVPGAEGGYYRSAIVVRSGDTARRLRDLRGRRVAYNAEHSQSGYNSFRLEMAKLHSGKPFFSAAKATGSHEGSLRMLQNKEADVAAIDPISLYLQGDDLKSAVRIIGWTEAAPGLPFITSAQTSDAELTALRGALARYCGTAEAGQDLPLTGFVTLSLEAYQTIPEQRLRAEALGYSALT